MQGKKSLLFIDSDVTFCEDMQRRFMLEPEFEVVGMAATAMDGFSKTQALQPRYAIIANALPDADASQLVSNMRMVSPQTSVIVALDSENPMAIAQYMQLGASYTLIKPYSADKLIDVINTLDRNKGAGLSQSQSAPGFGQPAMQQGFAQPMGFPQQQPVGNAANPFQTGMGQMPQGGNSPSPANPFQQQGFPQAAGFPQQAPQSQFGFPNQGGMPAGFGMGGFPQPQMNPHGMAQESPDAGRGGGFRTIKRKIIAVTCPKGGVGKSTVSKELAMAFSTVRVNGQPLRVLLVDCNLDFGDVATMLKVTPHPNISHWAADIEQRLRSAPPEAIRYTAPQIDKYLITHETGLKILAAPSNHADAVNITEKQTKVVFNNIENSSFDVIILDTGNNTKDFTLQALDVADVVLMVITPEVTTINDTNMLLSTLRSFDFPTSKIQLVLNKFRKTNEGYGESEITSVLRTPIIGTIPEYPRILQVNNEGVPAMLGRDNEFTIALKKIANSIVPVFNRAVAPRGGPPQAKKGDSGGGFLGKLFGKK